MHLLVSIWIDQLGDYVCPSFLLQLYYCMSQSFPFPFLLVGESAHMATGVLDSIVQGAICLKEVMPPMLRFLQPLL
jgi:hypothetical protein